MMEWKHFAMVFVAMLMIAPAAFADSVNQAPVITNVGGPTSLAIGQVGTWTISAYDPDGTYLTYDVLWGDASTHSPVSTATLQHTYQSAGTYTITFTVTDAAGASTQSTITVNMQATALPDYALTGIGMDGTGNVVNGQVVSISIPENAPTQINVGVKNNGASAQAASTVIFSFFGTSTQVSVPPIAAGQTAYANSYVVCTSSDTSTTVSAEVNQNHAIEESNYANNQLSVAVPVVCNHTSTNQPPVITSVGGPTSITANQQGTWSVSAYDPDGTYLTYNVVWGDEAQHGLQASSTFSSTATFQHTYTQAGAYTITYTVKDAQGATAQSTETVVVTSNTATNLAPVITSVSAPYSLEAGQAGTWHVSAYDPDGTYLTYSVNWGEGNGVAQQAPAQQQQTGSTATFQHTYATAGTYTVTFTVTDSKGASTQSVSNMVVFGSGNGCPGYVKIEVGKQLSNYNYQAYDIRLDSVGATAATASVMYNGVQLTQLSIPAHSSKSYSSPYGETVTVSVCSINNGQNYAFMKLDITPTTSSNLPPVITSVAGPALLNAGGTGTWKVSAYDPDGTYLAYGVTWGDGLDQKQAGQTQSGSLATFQHTYANAGTYTITFTATDSAGASTQSTLSVNVAGSTPGTGGVKASVGAVPTEVYQYDSVYVTGTVSRSADAASDSPQEYRVVLSLDNGNNKVAEPSTKEGSALIASGQETAKSGSIAASQGKEETITLAPGESKEVSAYFTASQLGTNFAKILVYQTSGSTQSGYILVASDSVKVSVKQGGSTPGIPAPPTEKMAISLKQGWNQVSVPTGYSVSLSDIQQKCSVTSAWQYDAALGQYSAATAFSGGAAGAWMKAGSDCTYELDAPYASTWSVPLKAGWNMIGAPAGGATLASVAGDCNIISGAWNYAPSASQYVYSSSLEPGKGYWVKVAGTCTLQGTGDMPPPAPAEVTPAAQVTAPQATTAATHIKGPQATEPAQTVQNTASN